MAAEPASDREPEPRPWTFPRDPRDGWEPGAPSIRALTPSAIGGAVVPILVYFVVRRHVHGDAPALAIAGIPAAGWVLFEAVRRRTLDPIGTIVLLGFVAGISASWALGGNAFVLKARDSAFTALVALASLLSLVFARKPLMFHIGRGLSAGADPERQRLFDELWDIPPSRAVFRLVTVAWGAGLLLEAGGRLLAAWALPTSTFVVVNPLMSATVLGTLFAFTVWFTRWSRARVEAMPIAAAGAADGGTTLYWLRRLLRPAPATGAVEA